MELNDLSSVYFDIHWPQDRPFQVVGQGMDAVDWVCVLPDYPKYASRVEISELHKLGGGPCATATALCARYGLKVRFIGRLGDDDAGRFSLADLEKEAMDLSCLQIVKGAETQLGIILVDAATGERTVLWKRDPRLAFQKGELQRACIVAGQLLHLDGQDQAASIQAARWAREAGMQVSLDIDVPQSGAEELLGLTSFLIPSLEFVRKFTGRGDWRQGLLELTNLTDGFVATTLGRKGSAAVWEGEIIEVPALSVESVDTTGAGDVFHGAFAYSLFQNWNVARCLRFASIAAGLACTRLGARNGIPTLEAVVAELAEDQWGD